MKKPSTKADVKAAKAQVRAYIAALPPGTRRVLKQLQSLVRAAAPDAEDGFTYRIPGLRLDDRPLVWYAAFTHHVSIYPVTDAIKRTLQKELKGYATSKGTVRFPLDAPLPAALVTRIVKARVADIRSGRR